MDNGAGETNVVSLLLKAGVDPTIKNGEGLTALDVARRDSPGAARQLEPLIAAALLNDILGEGDRQPSVAELEQTMRERTVPWNDTVNTELILRFTISVHMKVNVNSVGGSGNSALHMAAQALEDHGAPDGVVRMLLDAGADTQLQNKMGQIPSELARLSNNPKAARLMEETHQQVNVSCYVVTLRSTFPDRNTEDGPSDLRLLTLHARYVQRARHGVHRSSTSKSERRPV